MHCTERHEQNDDPRRKITFVSANNASNPEEKRHRNYEE